MQMTRIEINHTATKLATQFSLPQLWDRYKAAKLMDDKEEVAIFRKAIAKRKAQDQATN